MPLTADPASYHQNRYAAELNRLVTEGCRWLDVGAGKTIHGGWIGPSCEDLVGRAEHLAGCDLVEDVLDNPYLEEARIADASALPWPGETFDLVSANMVVEHVADPVAMFAEVARVLRAGGAFVFVTPNRLHPVIRLAARLPQRVRHLYGRRREGHKRDVFPTYYRCNTPARVRQLAARAELTPEVLESFWSGGTILRGALGRLERRLDRHGDDLVVVLRK